MIMISLGRLSCRHVGLPCPLAVVLSRFESAFLDSSHGLLAYCAVRVVLQPEHRIVAILNRVARPPWQHICNARPAAAVLSDLLQSRARDTRSMQILKTGTHGQTA